MSELLGGEQRLLELMQLMKETSETVVWICSHWEFQGCSAGKATLGPLRKGVRGMFVCVLICLIFFQIIFFMEMERRGYDLQAEPPF